MNDNQEPQWKAVAYYRTENGTVDVEHYFEELEELDQLIEGGPHFDTIEKIEITMNRLCGDDASLTIETAERL